MTNEEQNVWWKLVGIANWCACHDGTLRHGFGAPMTREWIAERCQCTRKTLDKVIAIGQQDRNIDEDGCRVKVWEDGTIELCNFKQYNPDGPIQTMLPPAVGTPPEEPPRKKSHSEGKLRTLHNKYQDGHTEESAFRAGSIMAGVKGGDRPEFRAQQERNHRQKMFGIRKGKQTGVASEGGGEPPRLSL
ncbi:MAG: hypothetical protein WC291_11735 [Thermodesulfovibrionales bacterium]|jgi:hypothetical protein